MSTNAHIAVRGARENNLCNVDVDIRKHALVVMCGVSGSGKSSLAFDTVFAEGQRRYVEALSSYARQFIGQMDKPDYDTIRGLTPTIAVSQRNTSGSPRSTVGTLTEISDHLRVLYARAGVQHCPDCGQAVDRWSAAQIVDQLCALPEGTRVDLLGPVLQNRRGAFAATLAEMQRSGFSRVRLEGRVVRLDTLVEQGGLEEGRRHDLDVVVDRVRVGPEAHSRFTDSVETALKVGQGTLKVLVEGRAEQVMSEKRACHDCGLSFPDLSPASFSFNSPRGMCPDCKGLGTADQMDPQRVIPDHSLSVEGGAVEPWRKALKRKDGWTHRMLAALAEREGFRLDTPWKDLSAHARQVLLYGLGEERFEVEWAGDRGEGRWEMQWEGILPTLSRRLHQTKSEGQRKMYRSYMSQQPCGLCKGTRLRREAAAVRVGGTTLVDLGAFSVADARSHLSALQLTDFQTAVASELLKELDARLGFLEDVGLDYLSLDRPGDTLSGGEAQRIRLASQLGGELSGVTYVLDEPTIGLHPRDNLRLIATLERLRDIGNTVLVVEHDEDTIRAADQVVDFGPGAGRHGGQVVFTGTPEALAQADTLTGRYLGGRLKMPVPQSRRGPSDRLLRVRGARLNNLQNIDVDLPLGRFVVVTGVSGAGKSSLVRGILAPALHNALHGARQSVGDCDGIDGIELLDKVIDIDQKPIGRTPRSNPATYTKLFDLIRTAFSETPEARTRGFKAGRFSFNSKGGRCEACKGDGRKKIEMHFLADIYVACEVCGGRRFDQATLTVKYRGLDISEVLQLTVSEALETFSRRPKVRRILQTLDDVGLGYIQLGQPAHTLSGGEAQRIKLSRELARPQKGQTLYLLDEPTTGLHYADTHRLLDILQKLVDDGASVIVVEHDVDVMRAADHIIDLGPGGGASGGRVVAEGTPEAVAQAEGSHTGRFLAKR